MKLAIKKITGKIHLCLGLFFSLVVLVVSTTGCIYVFKNEINRAIYPWWHIKAPIADWVPPTLLLKKVAPYLKIPPTGVEVYPDMPAAINCFNGAIHKTVYLNPVTGNYLYTVGDARHPDFFNFILKGHTSLWLPKETGKIIIGISILGYMILLITGLVLWLPARWKSNQIKQRLKIKISDKWKRTNYDMHNVLGFYSFFFLLTFSITGLSVAFPWFSQGVYNILSNGRKMPPQTALSDTSKKFVYDNKTLDDIYALKKEQLIKTGSGYNIRFPKNKSGAILFGINEKPGTYYKLNMRAYDQHDMSERPYEGRYAGTFDSASLADKGQRLNYDIHVGAWGGLTTKIIAFLTSLISVSLPITGILIYIGRKKKKMIKTTSS